MDALAEAVERLEDGWVARLREFCAENAECWTFAGRLGDVRSKERLLAALWARVSAEEAREEEEPLLTLAMRLLLREDAGAGPTAAPQVLTFFLRRCGLLSAQADAAAGDDEKARTEALRMVVNLATRHGAHRDACVAVHCVQTALTDAVVRAEGDDARLFLLYRLLVQLTLSTEHAETFRANAALLPAIARDLARCPPTGAPSYAADALLAAFTLTAHLGPLNNPAAATTAAAAAATTQATAEEVAFFRIALPFFDAVLQHATAVLASGGSRPELLQGVLSCLVNSPKGWTELVDPAMLDRALAAFLAAARNAVEEEEKKEKQHQLATAGGAAAAQVRLPSKLPEMLIPPLMLLMGIMESPRAMQFTPRILDALFPPDYRAQASASGHLSIEGPTALQTSECLGVKLAKHMTTTNVALKHIVQEFLFEVCGHNPNLLCTLTGVGLAAGLLQTHNLLGGVGEIPEDEVSAPPPAPSP